MGWDEDEANAVTVVTKNSRRVDKECDCVSGKTVQPEREIQVNRFNSKFGVGYLDQSSWCGYFAGHNVDLWSQFYQSSQSHIGLVINFDSYLYLICTATPNWSCSSSWLMQSQQIVEMDPAGSLFQDAAYPGLRATAAALKYLSNTLAEVSSQPCLDWGRSSGIKCTKLL